MSLQEKISDGAEGRYYTLVFCRARSSQYPVASTQWLEAFSRSKKVPGTVSLPIKVSQLHPMRW